MSVLASRNVVQCRLTNRTSCCRMCWASHCRGIDTADVPVFERINCILRLLRMQGVSRSNSRRDRLFPQNNTWIFLEGSWMLINLSPIWRIYHSLFSYRRYQWPRGLRRWSAAARLLGLWVRIPPGARIVVCCECCVFSGRGLCDGPIHCPEKSYRVCCVQ